MDGTIVDTEPYWMSAEHRLAERHGGTWSDAHSLNLVGNDLIDSARYIRDHAGVDLSPERIVEELPRRRGAPGRRGGPLAPRCP